jgi:hypothetical protein
VPQKSGGKKKVSSIKSEYDGIKFDSQLEVYCYKKLKEFNIDFKYTETTFTIIEGFKCTGDSYEADKRKGSGLYLKSKSLQSLKYTPDFIVSGKFNAIIETKGLANELWPLRLKLFKKYLTDNNLKYDIYIPHNHAQVNECVQMILNKNNEKEN